ncbi:MAG: 1-acyl-sn-glycerol-3-phosphate acyltransferase [Bacteroidales bacterium]|jgi:1-acyl-sn-glycerol-3-phosphate acyltransferase|nr:1-acyl-sn-glycerol-3-phosphate acyltransferase [Bacteroidales bacterium]
MAESLEEKMCRFSKGYAFVLHVFVRPAFTFFYRKIQVIGKKRVPRKGPIIYTPNHQNALMDAICILCTRDRQPVFVARADIFQKPFVIKILHFLRILPIYRRRDGVNTSDNNQETFDILLKVLHHGLAVGIMPEGIHNEMKRLQILQKGVFRFALKAQEKFGNLPGVKIIPVGIEYSDTRKFRSDVIINYGEAIEMSDYYDLYIENPPRAFKQLQDTLSNKMKEGMINIENEEFYHEIEQARLFYEKRAIRRLGLKYNKGRDRLTAQQKVIHAMEDYAQEKHAEMVEMSDQIKEYVTIINKYDFRDWVVEDQPYSFSFLSLLMLLSILGFPFWLLGMIFNYIPYKLSQYSSGKIKDPQFVSSVQFVAGIVVFPVYYLIITILFIIFIPCIWGILTMVILFVPSALFAFNYYLFLKKVGARYRFCSLKRKKNKEILRSIELRRSIFEILDKIVV